MKVITTEIGVDAPVGRIWDLVSDTGLYRHWNPLFKEGSGSMKVGEHLELTVKLPGIDSFTINADVIALEPWSSFCWRHTMLFGGLFNWRYEMELKVLDADHTMFIQRSRFGGLLGPLFQLGMGGAVNDGLAEMNRAVKRWGERGKVTCLKC